GTRFLTSCTQGVHKLRLSAHAADFAHHRINNLLIPQVYKANDSVSGHHSIPNDPATGFSLKASASLILIFQKEGLNEADFRPPRHLRQKAEPTKMRVPESVDPGTRSRLQVSYSSLVPVTPHGWVVKLMYVPPN